ncbi:(Fe-S)-binding protein [Maridesulfovibrio zosterae]|uniref:(Fe-S)-binding protein n=1 Tax=Maridesulfovibrio zosterae TaxID=82171 RepID=UPI000419389A|nr:(Fe-S)-binding protein [Maridesulfovibrio zosterae]
MATPRACVQCGKCLEVCPLFKATGREDLTPRAKFFLENLDSSEGLSDKDFKSLASLCLSCGRCAKNCPQHMSGPEFVSALRSSSNGFVQNCWDLWLANPGILWPMAAALSRFSLKVLPEPFRSAKKRMKSLFATGLEPWVEIFPQVKFEERRVVLFNGCVGKYARHDWIKKADRLMNSMGLLRAEEPEFVCCGSSYGSAGLLERQNESRKINIRAWKDAGSPLLLIFCTTCLKGLKEYSLDDFSGDNELYKKWQQSLTLLSSLLLDADVLLLENSPKQIVYHKPCHAPVLDTDQLLLEKIAGDRLRPVLNDLCCGFGGIMQLAAPDLSKEVGEHCLERLTVGLDSGAHILTGCSACVIQLATLTKDEYLASHWLDILK